MGIASHILIRRPFFAGLGWLDSAEETEAQSSTCKCLRRRSKTKETEENKPHPSPSAPPVPIKQRQPLKNIHKEATVETPQEKLPEITPTQEEENLEVLESQILGTPRRKTHGLKKESQEKTSEEKEDVSAIDMEVQEALDRAKKRSEEAKLTPKKAISSPPPRQKKKKTPSRGKSKTYQPAARENDKSSKTYGI